MCVAFRAKPTNDDETEKTRWNESEEKEVRLYLKWFRFQILRANASLSGSSFDMVTVIDFSKQHNNILPLHKCDIKNTSFNSFAMIFWFYFHIFFFAIFLSPTWSPGIKYEPESCCMNQTHLVVSYIAYRTLNAGKYLWMKHLTLFILKALKIFT